MERLTGLLHKRDDEIARLEGRVNYFYDENKRLQAIEHDMDLLKSKYGVRVVDVAVSKIRYEKQMRQKSKKGIGIHDNLDLASLTIDVHYKIFSKLPGRRKNRGGCH